MLLRMRSSIVQDELSVLMVRMRSSIVQDEFSALMVRSAATPRVSNHEPMRHSVE
jgi:hypothetical protein